MLTTRKAHKHITLNAEELEVTLYEVDQKQIEDMIIKLEYVIADLQDYLEFKSEDK